MLTLYDPSEPSESSECRLGSVFLRNHNSRSQGCSPGGVITLGLFLSKRLIKSNVFEAREIAEHFLPRRSKNPRVACLMHDFRVHKPAFLGKSSAT